MKNPQPKRWRDRPAIIEEFPGQLLSYETIRLLFGWTNNSTIREHVKAGHFQRVRTSNAANGYRITAASAIAYRAMLEDREQEHIDRDEAQAQTMRAARGFPNPAEVLLDQEEIIDSYNAGRAAMRPAPVKPTLDEALQSAPVPAPSRPDWRARNAWIEGGCVGVDPWAPQR